MFGGIFFDIVRLINVRGYHFKSTGINSFDPVPRLVYGSGHNLRIVNGGGVCTHSTHWVLHCTKSGSGKASPN